MAIYAVSKTNENWDATERFNYKTHAVERFQEIAATGQFVRLVRWNNNQAKELDRANALPASDNPSHTRPGAVDGSIRSPKRTTFAIFVSYRRDDSAGYTGRLFDRLIQPFGRECVFMDIDAIPLGVAWTKHVKDSVGRCNVLLAVIGKAWLAVTDPQGCRRLETPDDFVRLEIASALERNIPVIPLMVGGAVMPRPHELPEALRSLAYRAGMELHDTRFHTDVDRLIAELKGMMAHSAKIKPSPGAPVDLRVPATNTLRFEGVIRGESQLGTDGRERHYIAVQKRDAEGFPYHEGSRVQIELEIDGKVFSAGTRTTPSQEIVYIASDLRNPAGEKVSLVSVLESSGLRKNQRVTIEVDGNRLRVLRP